MKRKLKRKELLNVFQQYEKDSYLTFLVKLKTFLYSKNPFDYILNFSTSRYDFFLYLQFLIKEKIIFPREDGKINILKKEILEKIPPPLPFKEIKRRIERKLKIKLNLKEPANSPFKRKSVLEFDQLPISISSAFFLVEKILQYLPLYKKFLFVGDDDFISLYLCLANPKVEVLVVDIDTGLLEKINEVSKRYRLKIKTRELNIEKGEKIKDYFVGALLNPPYNFEGAKKFVDFTTNQFSHDGGVLFLVLGDESIGNRFLFLEKFFNEKNLICWTKIIGKIFYPQNLETEEERIIENNLISYFSKKTIKRNPMMGASLYVFEYIPFKIHPPKKQSIYTYL